MAPSHPSRPTCSSLGKITAKLLLSFLVLSAFAGASARLVVDTDILAPGDVLAPGPVIVGGEDHEKNVASEGVHEFSLRHILHHGTHQYPRMLRRLDVHPESLVSTEELPEFHPRPKYTALSQHRAIKRLSDRSKDNVETNLLNHRYGVATSYTAESWTRDEIPQPNITDKATVLALAKIAADAYVAVERTGDWLDVGSPYNRSDDFGWDGDGLRGHIFVDQSNGTVIIGLKGTSAAVFDGAETTTNDKVNDNLLFSCCCARVSYFWSTVCDCYSGTAYTCDNMCLKRELMGENRYYRAALNLYYNVTTMYPDASVWVVGHSLGGALSSLIGQTYGLPVVTFEAPGEALAAERLGLPMPPSGARQSAEVGIYHFGHTADPVFMGACNGPTSVCAIGGYAMETHCHSGMECVYDVVGDKGWRMGLGYHRIQGVIRDVIEVYDDVPECTFEPGCVDCFNWKYVSGNDTHTTTTSTTAVSTTTSSTTTCFTPGWWGCRDITTTATTGTPSTTSSTQTATETCTHYGWFGKCLDSTTTTTTGTSTTTPEKTSTPTMTTITKTLIITTSTASETCSHYGFFGKCLDPTSTIASSIATAQPTTSETCSRHGWFGGCLDPEWSTPAPGATTSTQPESKGGCQSRALWGVGWCREWAEEEL